MWEKLILTAGPSITELEERYVLDAVRNGWNENWSGYIRRFEEAFAAYVGTGHAMTTSSCTGAMHLALLALGVGPGDEVIVPEITWVATANVVRYVGATPVFCDVEEGSWCMDPASMEAMITPRTRAVMPVHLYGHPAAMTAIMTIAEKHGLYVVEDAAPSVGAEVDGRRVGGLGHAAAFSFQGAKVMVTGEGGMLVTSDRHLFERADFLNGQARDPDKPLWNLETGYKYKMSNIQAALGLAQLERIEELVGRKREINRRYAANLADCNSVAVSTELAGRRSIHWMTSVEVLGADEARRNGIIAALRAENVDSRPVFYPLSSMDMFERRADNPVAWRVGHNTINLPSGHNLTEAEIDYVSETVRRICGAA